MQSSAKKIWLVILVVALVAGVAVASRYWLPESTPLSARDNLPAMIKQIPADTPFVAVGHNTPEGASEQMDLWLKNTSTADLQPALDYLRNESQHPSAPLAAWLLDDYFTVATTEGYSGLVKHYGLDPEGAFAFYIHGAMPVLRMSLSDPDKLLAVLDQAEAESGVVHRNLALGDAQARAWTLVVESASADFPALELGMVIENNQLTVSLLTDRDAADARLARFALQPLATNLADAGTLDQWRDEFERADLMIGYFDFHRLAQAFLLPEQNSTGRELTSLFPELATKVNESLSATCRQEYVGLIQGAPRAVFGTTSYEVDGNRLETGMRSIWSIENTAVLTELQRLPGYLPNYSRNLNDKMLAFAVGIDVDQLVPVLTKLWRQFIDAPFQCEQLQSAQLAANQANPMMLSMATAMARGVKGVGVAVYDLFADPTSPAGLGGTTLVSISAEDPAALVSLLTSYAPGMAGTKISPDGTPVPLQFPGAPADTYIAIKGSHIVLYRGEKAEQEAEALGQEPLSANGTAALALNLGKVTESLMSSPDTLTAMAKGNNCQMMYYGLLQLNQTPFEFSYQETINDLGWDGRLDVAMNLAASDSVSLPGTYNMMTLADDCSWEAMGTEELRSDGTGLYHQMDESETCATLESEYSWEKVGGQLVQKTLSQRSRPSCDTDWEEQETEDFSCSLMKLESDGFYCVWQEGTEVDIYHYQRQ